MHGVHDAILLPYPTLLPPLQQLDGELSVPKYRRILVQHVEKVLLYK